MPNLTKCKDCGHTVSKNAKTCPSCGVQKPGVPPTEFGKLFVTAFVIVMGSIAYFNYLEKAGELPEAPSVSRDPHYAISSIQRAIAKSDNYATYQTEFTAAAQSLLSTARCQLNEMKEYGGFVKSQAHKDEPVYFVFCGGMTIKNRIYVDVSSGELFTLRNTN